MKDSTVYVLLLLIYYLISVFILLLTFLTFTTVLVSDVNVRNAGAINLQMLSLHSDISLRDTDNKQQFRCGKYKSANSPNK